MYHHRLYSDSSKNDFPNSFQTLSKLSPNSGRQDIHGTPIEVYNTPRYKPIRLE